MTLKILNYIVANIIVKVGKEAVAHVIAVAVMVEIMFNTIVDEYIKEIFYYSYVAYSAFNDFRFTYSKMTLKI